MKIKCPNCGYVWNTNSELGWVTCPNCMKKFRKLCVNPIENEGCKGSHKVSREDGVSCNERNKKNH